MNSKLEFRSGFDVHDLVLFGALRYHSASSRRFVYCPSFYGVFASLRLKIARNAFNFELDFGREAAIRRRCRNQTMITVPLAVCLHGFSDEKENVLACQSETENAAKNKLCHNSKVYSSNADKIESG